MDKGFFESPQYLTGNYKGKLNLINMVQSTNDNLVNDFLNENISLESLIEKEIYKVKL